MIKNQAIMMETQNSTNNSSLNDNKTGVFPMTVRFEHESSTTEGNHLILTTRKGNLETCEDEPIHAPGAVQSYGVLIAFDRTSEGKLVVAQVSENSTIMLGITPDAFFNASCLTELLEESEADTLLESIEILDEREAEEEGTQEFAPYGFELSGSGPGSSTITSSSSSSSSTNAVVRHWTAYAALHRPNRILAPERLILELELIDQSSNYNQEDTMSPELGKTSLDEAVEGRGGEKSDSIVTPLEFESELEEGTEITADIVEASEEDVYESTVAIAIPLKEMVRLKRRRGREITRRAQAGEVDPAGLRQRDDQVARDSHLHVVQLLGQVEDQLARAQDLNSFYKITAGVFKELTEFDRAMIYKFDEKWNGAVIAEQVDYSKTQDLYRGLHFPASDIPAQARELYKINKVRLLYDRTQKSARMCCRSIEEVETPLDMSQAFLRAMSPIHLVYLANMGVRSTMSISIIVFGELWGLVALHHYGTEGHRVSFPIRALCRLLSESIGRNIERLMIAKRLELRNAINAGNTVAAPVGYILASGEDILALFKADFGFISIGGETKMLGNIGESEPELLALRNYIDEQRTPDCLSAMHINSECKDLNYAGGFKHVAGFMSVPLARRGKDFIVFCRRGQTEEIRWGGNPDTFAKGKQSLNPRNSFKSFSTTVVGQCRSWALEQQDNPTILLLTYGKFIDVWRSKEALLSTTRLANQLMSDEDISTEVRTPLTSVLSYIDIALDGPLDTETKEAISSTNSKSLVRVINDLLIASRDRLEGKIPSSEAISLSPLSL